jgi:uncharacterized membrane protein YhaH (DUF805 family)
MAVNVQLVFRGEVLDGFVREDVRRRLTQALRLDEARAAQLFSGVRTVLNQSLDPALARLYAAELERMGARIHLEAEPPPPPPSLPPIAFSHMPPAVGRPEASNSDFPPLPELPEVGAPPPPPPWGATPRPSRPAPLDVPPAFDAPAVPPPARGTSFGELSLEPVQEVTCPNCGERQSQRLLCHHCSTNLEVALAHKADEAARAREARIDKMNARAGRRPLAATTAAAAAEGPRWFGLDLVGRMGRMPYATASFAALALACIPLIMAIQRPTLGRILFFLLAALAVTLYGMRLAILRCHDCDKTGWWSLLLWLPTVNVIVSIVLALAPGTDGPNEYGPAPPPGSAWAAGASFGCLVLLVALTFSHLMRLAAMAADRDGDDDGRVEFRADPRAAGLPTLAQQAGFNEQYLGARGHKAFAVSPAGAWSFAEGRASASDAARAALQECEARRAAYTAACSVVNVNGQWLGK